jgi:hypothetical protein
MRECATKPSIVRLLAIVCITILIAVSNCVYSVSFAALGGLVIGLYRYVGKDTGGVRGIDFALPGAVLLACYVGLLFPGSYPSYDTYLLAIDQKLGLGWVIGRIFPEFPVVATLSKLAYATLPLAFTFLYLCLPGKSDRYCLWKSMIITGLLLCITYWLCPAAGPKYIFPGWPNVEPHMAPGIVFTRAPLNCMPSGHLTWALLFCCFSRKCRYYVKVPLFVFLILVALATLGLGEHYWIDLIAAIPFTALIYYLSCVRVTIPRMPACLHFDDYRRSSRPACRWR